MFPDVIQELDQLLPNPTNIYIDWQNVYHAKDKLGWIVDQKRLKQFLDSYDQIGIKSIYNGTLQGNQYSEKCTEDLTNMGYRVCTKPVKIMSYSIEASSIPANSPVLVQPFIRKPLLSKMTLAIVEGLNLFLGELNKLGLLAIEDQKCNFDVEIGRDLYRDLDSNLTKGFILWSGDSDFVDPIKEVMDAGKIAILFAFSGSVAKELSELKPLIFDIRKIKEFICRKESLTQAVRSRLGIK